MEGKEKVTGEKQEDDVSSSSKYSENDKISSANKEERNNDSKDGNDGTYHQVVDKKKGFINLTDYKKNYEEIEASSREQDGKNDRITYKRSKDKNRARRHNEASTSSHNANIEQTDFLPEEAYVRHMERVIDANTLPREDMEILKDLYTRYMTDKTKSVSDETRTETDIDGTKHGESTATQDQVKPIPDTNFKDPMKVIRSSVHDQRKDSVEIKSASPVVDNDRTDSFEKPNFLQTNDQILTSTPKTCRKTRRGSSLLEDTDDIECDVTNLTIESPFSDFSLQKVKLRTGLDRNYVAGEYDNEAGSSNMGNKEKITKGGAIVEEEDIREFSFTINEPGFKDNLAAPKKREIKDDSSAEYSKTKEDEYIEEDIREFSFTINEPGIAENLAAPTKREIKDDSSAEYSKTKGDEYIEEDIREFSFTITEPGFKENLAAPTKREIKDDSSAKYSETKGDEYLEEDIREFSFTITEPGFKENLAAPMKREIKDDSSAEYSETKGDEYLEEDIREFSFTITEPGFKENLAAPMKREIKDDSSAEYSKTKEDEYIEEDIREFSFTINEPGIAENLAAPTKREIKDDSSAKYQETKADKYIDKKQNIKDKSNEVKGTKDGSALKKQKVQTVLSVTTNQEIKDNSRVVKYIETKDIVKNQDIKHTTILFKKQETEKDSTNMDQPQFSINLPSASQAPATLLGTSTSTQLSSYHQNVNIRDSRKQFLEDLSVCDCSQEETNTEFNRNNDGASMINRIRRYFLSLSTEYLAFRQGTSNKSKISHYF